MNLSPLEQLCKACTGDDDHATIERVTAELAEADPDLNLSRCLALATSNGDNIELGRLLLANRRVDPSHNEHAALHWAVRYRRARLVELLLSDPKVNPNGNGIPLYIAIGLCYTEIEVSLLSHPHIDVTPTRHRELIVAMARGACAEIEEIICNPEVRATVDWEHLLDYAWELDDEVVKETVNRQALIAGEEAV